MNLINTWLTLVGMLGKLQTPFTWLMIVNKLIVPFSMLAAVNYYALYIISLFTCKWHGLAAFLPFNQTEFNYSYFTDGAIRMERSYAGSAPELFLLGLRAHPHSRGHAGWAVRRQMGAGGRTAVHRCLHSDHSSCRAVGRRPSLICFEGHWRFGWGE